MSSNWVLTVLVIAMALRQGRTRDMPFGGFGNAALVGCLIFALSVAIAVLALLGARSRKVAVGPSSPGNNMGNHRLVKGKCLLLGYRNESPIEAFRNWRPDFVYSIPIRELVQELNRTKNPWGYYSVTDSHTFRSMGGERVNIPDRSIIFDHLTGFYLPHYHIVRVYVTEEDFQLCLKDKPQVELLRVVNGEPP